jgi:Amt family ammonium transporter
MLVATALVMLMTPGLGLFYGGMVRSKNVLGTMMHSFMCLGLVSVLWVLFGYSLAFGPDLGGVIGALDWVGLAGVGMDPGPYSDKIPHLVFCAFQLMFAIITPALITGAFAERMKFSAFVLFTILWTTLVYFPVCHWVWGGGWLGKMGALDFAGGTVIHINSGMAALAAAIIMGRRKGYRQEPFYPNNITLTMLGAGCSGSDGSGSTQEARWQPTAWPVWPSSPPTLQPHRRRCRGSSSSISSGRNPRASVSPRAQWQVWWP